MTLEELQKKYKYLMLEAHIDDEWSEGPTHVLIETDTLDIVKTYQDQIARMKKEGLGVYQIRTFDNQRLWLEEQLPVFSPEFAAQTALLQDNKAGWYIDCDETVDQVDDTEGLEDAQEHKDLRTECDMLAISDDKLELQAYIKHTNVKVWASFYTKDIDEELLTPMTLSMEDYYGEDEDDR